LSYTFDKTFSITLLALSILFIFQATQISDSAYGSTVGPKIFPLGLGIILGLLSLQLFYESWKKAVRERVTGGPTTSSKISSTELKKFLIILGSALAYVWNVLNLFIQLLLQLDFHWASIIYLQVY